MQSKDIDSSEKSTCLNSDGLKLDRFTWSLPTVSAGGTVTVSEQLERELERELTH